MSKSRYLCVAAVVLAVCIVFGWEFATAARTGQNEERGRLAVLWTSADADVARNVCFMYTHAAKKQKWFDEVKLIVWGPSARLLAGDKQLQEQVKQMIADGVILQACVVCADRYGASEPLRKLGIEVRGMGRPLTEILRASNKMPLHSSGFFSGWLRCRAKTRPQSSFGYACGDFSSPPCHPKKRSLSM